ncbi:histidine phosphatase superfamily [Naematelia encephala]|uniref:Histidine phosphatase superfamily n=1 Tax=Naematelia encephala TaxID=71784 RepID=A0A1Y2ASU1_9TREE|nr:histidine phosphatase superfamily [Naematelia encephala]
MSLRQLLAVAAVLSSALAAPSQQPFSLPNRIDPLKHLSAISPFFLPTEKPTPLPPRCSLTRVSLLVRHSSIMGNDDEYEQTMGPFIHKIGNLSTDDLPDSGEWSFLREWETPIVEERLEELSGRGKKDAKKLGKYIRKQYDDLFPSKKRKSVDEARKGKKDKKGKDTTYKVWTASSDRDIESAKAYILGSFPRHQSGDDGHGDGEVVQLVKVPNKARDWDRSLTPHKACDAFEKQSSLEPASKWLDIYAPKVRARLAGTIPGLAEKLDDQDILAMQMLCGYETIAQGFSPFCHVFTDEEWLDFEYYMDVRFHYMMGYGNDLSPYLGMPWVKTAKHLLGGKDSDSDSTSDDEANSLQPLPEPKLPPNASHSQLLHPSFTHRESPAFVSVFLNLYNSSTSAHPASHPPSLDHRVPNRDWRTSHLVSFLGHVALERFHCKGDGDYVRAVVNGKHEVMHGCEDGLDGSCRWKTFHDWVDERALRWGDWESVCDVK